MNYMLVVITHGDRDTTLSRTLQSFRANVEPVPAEALMHADGAVGASYDAIRRHNWTAWTVDNPFVPKGFCRAAASAWRDAAMSSADYVFWLEHDFLFERGVDLAAMAKTLDRNPQLAQMQLMRDAVNDMEKKAGGLFESRPGQYLPRWEGDIVGDPLWHEQSVYMTTNPCLMRREFMVENPWPAYEEQCEGRFGIDLVAKGYTFGVWGDGSPWVRHIGERDGFGY